MCEPWCVGRFFLTPGLTRTYRPHRRVREQATAHDQYECKNVG
ncbi:hypothetical protein SPURM210S_06490 [Streptomyces purpurascens]